MILRGEEGVEVVLGHIVPAEEQLHPEGIRQVFILLFPVAGHHPNILNASLVQLANQALDQHLAVHRKHALGDLGIHGDHPHAEAGREDHGALAAVIGSQLQGLFRRAAAFINESLLPEGLQTAVDDAEGAAARLCEVPLAALVRGSAEGL